MGWDISFEQFLERKDAQNVQTKRIVGRSHPEQAKKVLEERFALVGTVEEFPNFLTALEQVTATWRAESAAVGMWMGTTVLAPELVM